MCLTDDSGDRTRTPVFYTHHKLCAVRRRDNTKFVMGEKHRGSIPTVVGQTRAFNS